MMAQGLAWLRGIELPLCSAVRPDFYTCFLLNEPLINQDTPDGRPVASPRNTSPKRQRGETVSPRWRFGLVCVRGSRASRGAGLDRDRWLVGALGRRRALGLGGAGVQTYLRFLVEAEAGAGRYQVAQDHVLLQT